MSERKIAIVTGGNAGIGFETSLALAKMGYQVIIIGRTKHKCEEAVYAINQIAQNDNCNYLLCDLSSQNEIKKTAAVIKASYACVDVLINNAGQVYTSYAESADGIEMQFATNHLAPFLLSYELVPLLKQANKARIVNVSSNSHYRGSMNFEDIGYKNKYNFFKVYAQSKLSNVLFSYYLSRLLAKDQITVNVLHPGLVKTNIGGKNTKWWESLAWSIWSSRGISVADGAKTSIYLATSADVEGVTGKYWNKCKAQDSSKISYDIAVQDRLWQVSEAMCHIEFK